jgi:AcrR family transcriptional regulator
LQAHYREISPDVTKWLHERIDEPVIHPRDADATRARILAAAAQEFGKYGIAGARVDRISHAASANKAMIYRYFGNKDDLFDAVFDAEVAAFVEAVPFNASDLPAYAGRLFDSFQARPLTLRLMQWLQLERPDGIRVRTVQSANERKVREIAAAHAAGSLPIRYAPQEAFAVIRAIAMSWNNLAPPVEDDDPGLRERRRRVVIDSVARIFMEAVPAGPRAGE